MISKSNGVLAAAFRKEMNDQDLGIKEAAARIRRHQSTVKLILAGKKVSERTLAQVEKAFPRVFAMD